MATDFKKIVAEAKEKQAAAAAELKAARELAQAEAAPMLAELEASKAAYEAAKEDYTTRKKEYTELFGGGGGGGGTKQKLATKRISWGKPSMDGEGIHIACVVSDPSGEKEDKGSVVLAVEEGVTATALAKAAAKAFEVDSFATGGQVRGLANSIKKLLDAAAVA